MSPRTGEQWLFVPEQSPPEKLYNDPRYGVPSATLRGQLVLGFYWPGFYWIIQTLTGPIWDNCENDCEHMRFVMATMHGKGATDVRAQTLRRAAPIMVANKMNSF